MRREGSIKDDRGGSINPRGRAPKRWKGRRGVREQKRANLAKRKMTFFLKDRSEERERVRRG